MQTFNPLRFQLGALGVGQHVKLGGRQIRLGNGESTMVNPYILVGGHLVGSAAMGAMIGALARPRQRSQGAARGAWAGIGIAGSLTLLSVAVGQLSFGGNLGPIFLEAGATGLGLTMALKK